MFSDSGFLVYNFRPPKYEGYVQKVELTKAHVPSSYLLENHQPNHVLCARWTVKCLPFKWTSALFCWIYEQSADARWVNPCWYGGQFFSPVTLRTNVAIRRVINIGGLFILSQVRIFGVSVQLIKKKKPCLDFALTSDVRVLGLSSVSCMFVPSEVHASATFAFSLLLWTHNKM